MEIGRQIPLASGVRVRYSYKIRRFYSQTWEETAMDADEIRTHFGR